MATNVWEVDKIKIIRNQDLIWKERKGKRELYIIVVGADGIGGLQLELGQHVNIQTKVKSRHTNQRN